MSLPALDPNKLPREHNALLQEAGQALVRSLEGFHWRYMTLFFEVPRETDRFCLTSMDAGFDDPGEASRVRKELFGPFKEVMQKLFDVSGPEPWRTGVYSIWRDGDRIRASAKPK